MLVFTRRRDEAIVIGDGIEVRVLRVGRDGVRLGVSAPGHVAVHRHEIYQQIRDENRTAAAAPLPGRLVLPGAVGGRLGVATGEAPDGD